MSIYDVHLEIYYSSINSKFRHELKSTQKVLLLCKIDVIKLQKFEQNYLKSRPKT